MSRIHVFSNLFAFSLVSIHFAQQMSSSFHPEDRTGLTTYIIVSILVITGFLNRFQLLGQGKVYPPHRNRFLHISLTTAFYIVVIIHILHTLGFLFFEWRFRLVGFYTSKRYTFKFIDVSTYVFCVYWNLKISK